MRAYGVYARVVDVTKKKRTSERTTYKFHAVICSDLIPN